VVTKYKAAVSKRGGKAFNPLISLAIIAIVLVGGFYGGRALGWWGGAPATPTAASAYSFVVYDGSNGDVLDNDNGTIEVYREDISELTASELADYEALFANFELDESIDLDETYTPEAGYVYRVIFNSSAFENQSIIPVLGSNIIVTAQLASSYADLCYSDALDATTLNTNSTASVWNFAIAMLNGDGNMDTDLGLVPQVDFENGDENFFVLELAFNTTVSKTDVLCSNLGATEALVGTNMTYTFEDLSVFGTETFTIELDEDKVGVTWDITAASLYFGDTCIAVFA
jgi:hypothetical protein